MTWHHQNCLKENIATMKWFKYVLHLANMMNKYSKYYIKTSKIFIKLIYALYVSNKSYSIQNSFHSFVSIQFIICMNANSMSWSHQLTATAKMKSPSDQGVKCQAFTKNWCCMLRWHICITQNSIITYNRNQIVGVGCCSSFISMQIART